MAKKTVEAPTRPVVSALVAARQEGLIHWNSIEDRLRRPRAVSMWDSLPDFAETVLRSYRRDIWATQPRYIEVWLEKDALSGIFEDVLAPFGVTLNVGRGYDGWTSIKDAAARYKNGDRDGNFRWISTFLRADNYMHVSA
jgi:hypothetical protein